MQESSKRMKNQLNVKDIDKKVKKFEDMLPGPYTLGHVREEENKLGFNVKDILKFQQVYKNDLYDTFIKKGEHYQAYIPDNNTFKGSFYKNRVIFGLPPLGPEAKYELLRNDSQMDEEASQKQKQE